MFRHETVKTFLETYDNARTKGSIHKDREHLLTTVLETKIKSIFKILIKTALIRNSLTLVKSTRKTSQNSPTCGIAGLFRFNYQ